MFSSSARAGRAIAIILSCAAFVGAFQASDAEGPTAAKAALFNARYDIAADLYRKELARNPGWDDGYHGLVRALLRSHHADEAFKAAEDGLHMLQIPQAPKPLSVWRASVTAILISRSATFAPPSNPIQNIQAH